MRTWYLTFLCLIAAAGLLTPPVSAQELEVNRFRVVAYYTSYSIYEPAEYLVTDIPVEYLTHLIYAHIDISDNGQCVSSDEWADTGYPYPGDLERERLRGNFKQLALLKEENPDLQILMSIGGWDFSENFSEVASTQDSRIRFARSCITFMRQYGFDGIDLDWRFPVTGGKTDNASESDSENLTLLISEFRGQLTYWDDQDNTNYLLTLTAPAVEEQYQHYELNKISTELDWINVLAFSFQGEWSELAGHHAPLFGSDYDPRDPESRTTYTVDGAVNGYLDQGVPADKIVVGVPFFAQTWRNVEPNDNFGLYSSAGGIPSGTRPGGTLYYRDIVAAFLDSDSYTRFFDRDSGVPWMYDETARIAISYENPESVLNKALYVRRLGLGGLVAWELSFDDAQHSLMRAMFEGLKQRLNSQ